MSHTFLITNGDITYVNTGNPAFTQNGSQKLSQDLDECTIVPINDIGFGMGLDDLVGQVDDPDEVPAILESAITQGISRLQALQQQNQRLIRDNFELISTVAAVQAAFASPTTLTDFSFSYAVLSVNGASGGAPASTVSGGVSSGSSS